jgi:SpoVK/Ycf46/Vps4 family AAA+-type ATPase
MIAKIRAWQEANQRYLTARLAIVRAALVRYNNPSTAEAAAPDAAEPSMENTSPAAMDELCRLFHLSAFERDVLLLCAGIELDSDFIDLCASAQGDPRRNYPTFSLALASLKDPFWAALSPEAPLRRWRLIEVEQGRTLAHSPLHIDERILHYLVGLSYVDQRLAGLVQPLVSHSPLSPSHQQIARELAATWIESRTSLSHPLLQLTGDETESKRAIAAAAVDLSRRSLYRLAATDIPAEPGEFEDFLRLWEREARLGQQTLYLDADEVDPSDTVRDALIGRWIEASTTPLFLAGRERRKPAQHSVIYFDVQKPTVEEQAAIWERVLDKQAGELNGQLHRLAAQFRLSSIAIEAVCTAAKGLLVASQQAQGAQPKVLGPELWEVCRAQSRPRLDDLAQRIEPTAAWEDLVLPEAQKTLLHEIAMHVRQRDLVYQTWDFAGQGRRGLGISALFAGESGVGKTMAAEVLAGDLDLDLYRIDLSAVVSKYIGETEKNLKRLFDAAEESGVILLFDEADALFGKRSEVKDSHDRYANIEISYLLQRMEAYRGLAILTTNLKDTVDRAFLRRIRFIVQFPFPDAAQRAEIWRGVFPKATPTAGLDADRLAQLNLSGGNIRNVALNAAFLAADAGEQVRMAHLLRAARNEYTKLERPLSSAETRGWDESEG